MSVNELTLFRSQLIERRAKRYQKWVPMYERNRETMVNSDYTINKKIVRAIRWCKSKRLFANHSNELAWQTLQHLLHNVVASNCIVYFASILRALPNCKHRHRNELIMNLADGPRRSNAFAPSYYLLRRLLQDTATTVKATCDVMKNAVLNELSMSLTEDGFVTEFGAGVVIEAFLQPNNTFDGYVCAHEFHLWQRLRLAAKPSLGYPRWHWKSNTQVEQHVLSVTPVAKLGEVMLNERNCYLLQSYYNDTETTAAWKLRQAQRVVLARATDIGIAFAPLLAKMQIDVASLHAICSLAINAELNTTYRFIIYFSAIDQLVESALCAVLRHLDLDLDPN